MAGYRQQAWVTSVCAEDDVSAALVLARSLRRGLTNRTLAVVISPRISPHLRELLHQEFDSIHMLEEDRNTGKLSLEDFAKLYALTLRVFEKCIFLSSNALLLKNCDDIFENISNLTIFENMDTSVFGFQPSLDMFKSLIMGMQTKNQNDSIGKYLKLWMKNQTSEVKYLDPKYNKKISLFQDPLLSDEKGTSIVTFAENPITYLPMLTSPKKPLGFLETMAVNYWSEIFIQEVQPIQDSMRKGSVTQNGSLRVSPYEKEPVAIIGMSCRYPSSNNLDEFWNLILNGENGLSTCPDFRWLREDTTRCRPDCRKTNAGFLKNPIDEFDAKFFGISPKEAVFLDPQHRLLHELIWEGLEDAGIDPLKLRGSNGAVFMGSWTNDFRDVLVHAGKNEFYRMYMGNSIGAAAARISFLLGLTGPSVATESGCSSAMVAVHMACRSLLLGETNMALACGVNLLLHPFDKDEMPMVISPTGSCKTFDANADGFARAEGCGVLVLKRLSDAVKDNDNIWAIIRGSGMSQEGISKSMGTPTVLCEALSMTQALNDARVEPHQVAYVEAHGTGTSVGDPMEISAIAKAYHTPKRVEPLVIGSVKTNVGHTESCSGLTGIMKVVLALGKEVIPPHRNLETLNPVINLDAVPAVIPLQPVPWPRNVDQKRIAGVSSFGITGTDAHAIIEEAPSRENYLKLCGDFERPLHILKLSAKTDEALDILVSRYQHHLQTLNDDDFENFVYTANSGRANFNCRAAAVVKHKDDALQIFSKQQLMRQEASEDVGKICFLFTGQGSQYPGMAKSLYKTSPIFKMHFDHCDQLLNTLCNVSVKNVLWSETESDKVSRTIYSQTSIFCVEYALLKLWESWGVKPDCVLGHSLGEFAAAVCAKLISVEDAIKLVAERSRLIDELPEGKMLVIKADKPSVDGLMKRFAGKDKTRFLDYAAINSPQQTVVAGNSKIVQEFSDFCLERNIKTVMLQATHAFHSKHMDPMLKQYRDVAKTVEKLEGDECQYISGMTGSVVKRVDADYWVQHTREKVEFLRASQQAVSLGCQIFIEIGPQPVLSALTMMNNDCNLVCVPSLKKNELDWTTLLNTLAKLYLKGVDIDWKGYDQFYNRKIVRIPHYPFQGKRHWPDMMALTSTSIHPLLGAIVPNASATKLFQNGINLRSVEFIKDHCIGKQAIFPGAGYLEMCLSAGHATVESCVDSWTKPNRVMKVENVSIEAPLALDETKTCQMQTVVNFVGDAGTDDKDWNTIGVKIYHRLDTETIKWIPHASATFSPLPTAAEQEVQFDVDRFIKTKDTAESDDKMIGEVYGKLASLGLKFGPMFQSLEKIWKDDEGLLAQVKVPTEDVALPQFIVHPAILDAMIQAIMLMKHSEQIKKKLHVPISIGKFIWFARLETDDEFYIYISSSNDEAAILLNQNGKVLGVMSNVEFIHTTVKAIESVLEQQTSAMPDLWEESWRGKLGPMQHRIETSVLKDETVFPDEFFDEMCKRQRCPPEDASKTFETLDEFVYYTMLKTMYDCGWEPDTFAVFSVESFMTKYGIQTQHRLFLQYIFQVFAAERLLQYSGESNEWKVLEPPMSSDDVRILLKSPLYSEDLIKQFDSTRLMVRIGENLCDILKGKVSGLSILFPEGEKNLPTVTAFYDNYGAKFNIAPLILDVMRQRVKHFQERNPAKSDVYRIIEVGSGTGVYSDKILTVLQQENMKFEYMYTDISPAFFSEAEKRFEPHLKSLKFKKLNIEEDPVTQGFVPGYYDLVVASDVIHATKYIGKTLQNIRKLLRIGGSLDIMEQIQKNRSITWVFGTMEGFWHFEDTELRHDHCTLTAPQWETILSTSGFEGTKVFPAFEGRHGFISARAHSHIFPFSTIQGKKTWMLFSPKQCKLSQFIKNQLEMYGRQSVVVYQGYEYEQVDKDIFQARANKKEDFDTLIKTIQSNNSDIEGVVYLWALDKGITCQEDLLQPYLYLTQLIITLQQKYSPKLFVVNEGVAPVEGNDITHFYPSTLWGFTKTLKNENSDTPCRCISISSYEGMSEGEMEEVFQELWCDDKEIQVAFTNGTRHIARLQPLKSTSEYLNLPAGTNRFQLILPESKAISDLQFGPLQNFILGEQDVEIQVKASALNFRDVFTVLKPTDDFKDSTAVGFDFAGVIKEIGTKVTKWKVGDLVFGVNFKGGALPSHVKFHEDDVAGVPDNLTLCEAATLPAVFSTSYHCLVNIANVQPSDTVLVHTASGGVGLSAIEILKGIGATIIATAGSKRKRDYLRTLGIKHVFHSRNTSYLGEILKVTNGGVDVVLNSLTSEGFKEASLQACKKGARFVEMSKLSVWTSEEVRMIRPDVQYTIADLSTMASKEWQPLMYQLNNYIHNNMAHPIPYVRFDGLNIREALKYLQKAKHIGKVVCVMPELVIEKGELKAYTPMFNNRSTYLITGGLGGIGFEVAKWMIKVGAKHILLAGRNEPSPEIQSVINQVNSSGANITTVKLDVGNYEMCKELFESVKHSSKLPPLRGIMHAAGTLSDSLIVNQSWEKLSATFNAKIEGTLNLHRLSKDLILEHFVLFSSIASLFGSPGQANHSAGNNFEDTVAHYRHSIGLPATAINWGQWGQVGIATEVELPGMKALSTLQGMTALEYALKSQKVQMGVLNMESFVLFGKLAPQVAVYLDEKVWKATSNSGVALTVRSDEFWQDYDTKTTIEEKEVVIKDKLKLVLRHILKLDAEDIIDDNTNFQEMGVDSLMFVEIKNALQNLLGDRVTVTASALRDCNNVQLLSDQLIKLIEGEETMDVTVPTAEEVASLLQEDTILPDRISTEDCKSACAIVNIETVLITGATGTLGPYIIQELCAMPQIKKIICILRPTTNTTPKERLFNHLKSLHISFDSDKIECIAGNISKERLGIVNETEWESLTQRVDAIFHCAIRADHTQFYKKRNVSDTDVRTVNIGGLINVLELASQYKVKHMFHSSSILSVPTTDDEGNLSETWPELNDYDKVTSLAYPISKFAGDILMKKAIERGIPCKIFRFPLITGESKSGRCNVKSHLMLRYFYVLKCGIMPSNPFPLILLPVDVCANVSIKLFFDLRTPLSDIYNITHDAPDLDQEFPEIAQRFGYQVDIVELSEFTERLMTEPEDSAFSLFKQLYKFDDKLMETYMSAKAVRTWLEGTSENFWLSKKLASLLPDHYKNLKRTTEYLYSDLQYAESEGYFQKLGFEKH